MKVCTLQCDARVISRDSTRAWDVDNPRPMTRWTNYWQTVGGRVSLDRGSPRAAAIVAWLTVKGWAASRRAPARARIAYAPHPGAPWYTLPLALRGTGIRPTRDLAKADIIMAFNDRTEVGVQSANTPLPEGVPILNGTITDISKRHVGAVFAQVFGYALSVDPVSHAGPMVEKSNINGVHDGRVVMGPLSAPRADMAYQKLVDTHIRDGVTEDLRCVCVGGEIAQVFRKEKSTDRRFSTSYLLTELVKADAVFNAAERAQISQFCHAMGLDFGSIDVLRDHRGEGQIYIVDVNKTCMPVLSMPRKALSLGLSRIGAAAEAYILERVEDSL